MTCPRGPAATRARQCTDAGPKPPRIIEGSLRSVKPHPSRTALFSGQRQRRIDVFAPVRDAPQKLPVRIVWAHARHRSRARPRGDRPRLVRVSSTARRCESLYLRAMSSVLAWPSASATDTLRRESGPVDRSRTRRAAGRAHGTPCCALLRRGIAPRGRSHRPRSWGPPNPRPRTGRTTLPGPQTALNGESRVLPGFAPGCVRATAPVRWAIPLRNSPGDGHVAVVLNRSST